MMRTRVPTLCSCRSTGALLFLLTALLAVGCRENEPQRFAVSGRIAWNGAPVPAGTITFTPNASKGSSGPQGVASIHAGQYDTRTAGGRGAIGGQQIITISGFDGGPPQEAMPLGKRLFPQYQIEAELPKEATVLDLNLPRPATNH